MIKYVAMLLAGLMAVSTAVAGSSTVVTITKTTTLTAHDARDFSKIFGNHFESEWFSFRCNPQGKQCKISTSSAGFHGKWAEKLLNNRPFARYTSQNKKFSIDCGKGSAFWCNVVQRDAVLQHG